MERPVGLVSNNVVVGNARSEVTKWEEPISAKQESVTFSVKRKQSLQARYVYGFIFFITNLFAWFIRDYGDKVFTGLRHITACGIKDDDCFHAGGVLRVSFGCFIYFLFMFVTTFRASKLHDARNSWHSRWWALKFVLYLVSMMVSFIIPADFIQIYGEVARVGAGIFLLLQLISVIHFITWCNSQWMPDLQSKQCGFLGLFLSTIFYIATFCGIVLMYFMYAPDTSCTLNIFFITWTAILVKVMMVVSLHSKSFLIAICAIVMATFSTGIDSKSFQFSKDDCQSEDDIPYKYDVFHFIFSMGAMHFAMLFISWELNHSTKKWSIDVGWASTWVKIINEWFGASIYLWKLISPVVMRDKALDREEPVQHANGSV